MSQHDVNQDPYQMQADAQAAKDVAITKVIREYFKEHLDTYPSALHLVYTVLDAAMDSPSCGGSEPHALMEILNVVRNQVRKDDGASIPLLFPPTGEGDL
jgi:hypothetical protein